MSDAISKAIEALESALDYIDESPCDSDITAYQIVAYDRFLKSNAVAALAELKALQNGEPVVPEGYVLVPIHALGEWVTEGKGGEV